MIIAIPVAAPASLHFNLDRLQLQRFEGQLHARLSQCIERFFPQLKTFFNMTPLIVYPNLKFHGDIVVVERSRHDPGCGFDHEDWVVLHQR